MMKIHLLLMLVLLALPLSAYAVEDCVNIPVTIENPINNSSYPYSVAIPLEFSVSNADSCMYSIENQVVNKSISCSKNTNFDIDFDGEHTLTLRAENSTGGYCEKQVTFTVDRSNSFGTNPIFYGLLLFFMLSLSFAFVSFSKNYSRELYIMKGMAQLFGYFTMALSISLIGYGIREYLKISAVISLIQTFYYILAVFIGVLFIAHLYLLLISMLKNFRGGKK